MKKTFGIIGLCYCIFAMSSLAVADSNVTLKVSALTETSSSGSNKPYTLLPQVASKSCSTYCQGRNYSASCADNQECACDCNSGCTCK
jgi:hypothetical protein